MKILALASPLSRAAALRNRFPLGPLFGTVWIAAGWAVAQDWVERALETSPALQSLSANADATRSRIPSAGALPQPELRLVHFGESLQTGNGAQRQQIHLKQAVPWPGRRDLRERVATASARAAAEQLVDARLQLSGEVKHMQVELAWMETAILITSQRLALLRQLEDPVRERVRAGSGEVALLQLQQEIERQAQQLATRQREQEALRIEARRLVGGPLGMLPGVGGMATGREAPAPVALSEPPATRMLRANIEAAQARETLVRKNRMPDFMVGIGYFNTEAGPAPSADGEDDPWSMSLGIRLPLWGGALAAEQAEARHRLRASHLRLKDHEERLAAEIGRESERLKEARERHRRLEAQRLPLAERTRAATLEAYRGGKAGMLEVVDAEQMLLRLKLESARGLADIQQARIRLATLRGDLP